ncbi:hypothetical protein GE061_007338 [Apolygus lucorum]|uniref:Uncharacterized protein n=1 Tax=Apolygus lucorum TaxID=248454 RepID=A0A6A4J6G3_APOLU|nr:hypothetical protein GE061_007338 [Apolygus lucorum]
MEDEMALAEDFLRTMIDFLEHGSVENLVEGEVVNYFRMCKQIEIYNEKFKCKGYFMSMDTTTGVFTLSRSDVNRSKYDLNKLADKLFTMFCHPSTPSSLLSKALHVYLKDFGKARVGRCVSEISGLRPIFCVETIINRASEHKYNFEASLLMEGFSSISTKPRGMERVRDLLMELIIEDECAETVVAMFTVEDEFDPLVCVEIKNILLERLKEKFQKLPHARLWLRMVTSITVIDSINAYEPFLEFVLNLVKHLSSDITCLDSESKKFYSPPGSITYDSLVHVITKFYRNKKSCQKIINFIFNQCGANPAVWYSVLDSCHNIPTDVAALPYYDYSTPDLISNARSVEWKK